MTQISMKTIIYLKKKQKMIKNILLVIFAIMFFSCNNDKNIIYNDDGTRVEAEHIIDTIIDGKKEQLIDGYFKQFDKNNVLIKTGYAKKGVFDGWICSYYPSGNFKRIWYITNGKINGFYAYFEDNMSFFVTSNYVDSIANNVQVCFTNAPNCRDVIYTSQLRSNVVLSSVIFNDFGVIDNRVSSYIVIDNNVDTLKIGEEYKFKISFFNKTASDIYFVYGIDAYSDKFKVVNDSRIDTIYGNDSYITVKLTKEGDNYVRGKVLFTYKKFDYIGSYYFAKEFYGIH